MGSTRSHRTRWPGASRTSRRQSRKAARTVAGLELAKRPEGAAKAELVAALRAELADAALLWLDAVLALSGGGLAYPELLGTGGNDGRLDFTNNFARRLVSRARPAGLFDVSSGEPSPDAARLLEELPARLARVGPVLGRDRPVRARGGRRPERHERLQRRQPK